METKNPQEKTEIAGTARNGEEIPEGAIPLFKDSFGNTAFVKNIPNPNCPTTRPEEETQSAIYKSVREHKHIRTFAEARAIAKIDRPISGYTGSERPNLTSIEKSMLDGQSDVKSYTKNWTKDMSPQAAVERDWQEYEMFCKRGRFE